jgi:hypothetical protein
VRTSNPTEIHEAESLLPARPFEAGTVFEKFKRRSPGIHQIPRYGSSRRCTWNKEELPEQWDGCIIYLFIRRTIKLAVVINDEYHHFYQLYTKLYKTFFSQV